MRRYVLVLLLMLTFGLSMNASAELGLNAVAPQVGLLLPEDPWDSGFFIGAQANLGEVTENLELFPLVAYWSSGYSDFGFDLGLSNIQVGADVHYYLNNVEGLYVGGGASLNFLSVDVPSFNFLTGATTSESSSDTEFGFGVLAGYEVAIGERTGFVQGKYNIISNLNTIEITVGLFFDLGN